MRTKITHHQQRQMYLNDVKLICLLSKKRRLMHLFRH